MKPYDLTAGLRILIVEDEALIAMYMEDLLAQLGCTVVKAGRVQLGLHLIDTLHIDGAFLDVEVSGTSILPVAKSLKSRDIPFAFVTGGGAERVPAGFRDRPILAKPLAEPKFAEAVAAFASIAPIATAPSRAVTDPSISCQF